MDHPDPPTGRHRRPDPGEPAVAVPAPTVARHRASTPPVAEPPVEEAAVAAPPVAAPDTRSADLARFLAAAREHSTATPVPRGPGRLRRVVVVAVAAVGIAAAGWGLHRTSATPAGPTVGGSGVTTTPAAPSPTASAVVATGTPQPVTPSPTATGPAAVVASRPPVRVSEVPVVPVPATAAVPTGAAVGVPGRANSSSAWLTEVGRLFAARSAAFTAGRPELLSRADAPGSPLLRADQLLFDRVVRQAGFTRAAGLTFEVDRVRLLSSSAGRARLTVTGRQRAYVLTGPAGARAVAAGAPHESTLELTRSSTSAPWLMTTGAATAAS